MPDDDDDPAEERRVLRTAAFEDDEDAADGKNVRGAKHETLLDMSAKKKVIVAGRRNRNTMILSTKERGRIRDRAGK
jgi:hypothetical protein